MALESEYQGKIDMLLTDVVMPGMSGRDLALRLTRRRPRLRVAYMSGYLEDVMTFQKFFDSGTNFVEKPFYPNDLLKMVRQVLDQTPGCRVGG